MRILIIISDDLFIRNYLETDAFAGLAAHECHFAVSERCAKRRAVESRPNFAGVLGKFPAGEGKHNHLFRLLMWHYRRRSKTFAYRFSRNWRTHPNDSLRNALRNLRGLADSLKYMVLGSRLLGRFAIPRLIAAIPINPQLAAAVDRVRPDLLLFPSSAYDPLGNDVARIGKARRIPSLFLIDNWDNLSSKSIFWAPPDRMGVWGEQSREHAESIHGIPRDRVVPLGTPRFQGYYSVARERPASPFPHPYILFCGSALAFDELSALRALDRELAGDPGRYGGTRVVYRPHPWRQPRLCADEFREEDFRAVILDPQLRDAYHRRDDTFQPALDYYPKLLSNATLVVCPLTTMLVEALICGTRVLAITYDDGVHYTSPHNALRHYMHFEGIERIRGLSFCADREGLGAAMRGALAAPAPPLEAIHGSLRHFIHDDGRPYSERLRELVESAVP